MMLILRFVSLVILVAAPLRCALIEGRIVNAESLTPLGSAEVRIRRPGGERLTADLDTDSTGRFHAELPPGEYVVDAVKPNYLTTTLRITIPAKDLLIPLTHYGVIAGEVRDPQGQPAEGVRVEAIPVHQKQRSNGIEGRIAAADANGRYRFSRLTPGEYYVAISYNRPESAGGANFIYYAPQGQPQVFSLLSGEEIRGIDFNLLPQAAYEISGVVRLPKPKARFGVTLIAPDRPYLSIAHVQTDDEGKFQMNGIPAGVYALIAAGPVKGWTARSVILDSSPGFARLPLQVAGEKITGLAITPTESRSATVLLERSPGASGAKCPGPVTLTLTPTEDIGVAPPESTLLEAGRAKTIDGLAPAIYDLRLEVSEGCYQVAPVRLDLTAKSNAVPAAISMAPAGSIEGRIRGAAAPSQIEISLIPQEGTASVEIGTPNSDGHFRFSSLAPGLYRLRFQSLAEPKARSTATVEVSAGATKSIEIPWPKAE